MQCNLSLRPEIGTTCELRTATPVARPIQNMEIDLGNKTTLEIGTFFDRPLDVPNSRVLLYFVLLILRNIFWL